MKLCVGDVAAVMADFVPGQYTAGVVEEVDPSGFRIAKWWFGWHELVAINGQRVPVLVGRITIPADTDTADASMVAREGSDIQGGKDGPAD